MTLAPALSSILSSPLAPAVGEGGRYDPNAVPRRLTAKMQAGASDTAILWAGTSIGNDPIAEHVGLLDTAFATAFPTYVVRHTLYVATPPAAGAYVPQKLTGYTNGSALWADTFNRADGALGTASSGGQTYAANTWTISGNKAVQASSAQFLIANANLGVDTQIIEVDFTQGSGGGDARVYGLYTATNNAVFLGIVASTGVMSLFYASGGVSLANTATGGALTNGETMHIKYIIDGSWLQAQVTRGSTTYTIAAKLSSAQKTATTGTKFMISGINTITGQSWDNLTIYGIAQTRRLDVYNASVPGASLSYHTTNVATTMPVTFDLAVVEASHNEGSDSASTFQASLDTNIAAMRGVQANLPIAVMMENPQVSPAANFAAHNTRVASLPAYAKAKGYGLIDGYTGYDTANIAGDGIHPTSPAGSAFLETQDAAAFGIAP